MKIQTIIKFKTKDGKTVSLNKEEALELYQELKDVFEIRWTYPHAYPYNPIIYKRTAGENPDWYKPVTTCGNHELEVNDIDALTDVFIQ